MQIRTMIRDLLDGERLIGIYPPLIPEGLTVWQRRPNLYTGRSLSAVALETEQREQAGRLTTRAQMVSRGVISGLEVDLTPDGLGHAALHLAPGSGLTAAGEDVVIPAALRLNVGDLPVYAPLSILQPSGGTGTGTGDLAARQMGPSLGTLFSEGKLTAMPPAGIVVLQPVQFVQAGQFDENDPCENEPCGESAAVYEDLQILEACRVVFYAWPTDVLPLPAMPDSGNAGLWRNLLAYAIFDREHH